METEHFLKDVELAITQLTKQQPSLFGPPTSVCETCLYVKDVNGYTSGVVKILTGMGYCAKYDGEELGVKNTNSFNDQFDILTSANYIRNGPASYRSTCRPAWF